MVTKSKEKSIESKLIEYVEKHNGYVIKNQASATTGKGRPDLSICWQGQYVAIEVKRQMTSRKTTIMQLTHLSRIATAGGKAYISSTIDCLVDDNKTNYTESIISSPTFDILSKNGKELIESIINDYLRYVNFGWISIDYNIETNQLDYTIYLKE